MKRGPVTGSQRCGHIDHEGWPDSDDARSGSMPDQEPGGWLRAVQALKL